MSPALSEVPQYRADPSVHCGIQVLSTFLLHCAECGGSHSHVRTSGCKRAPALLGPIATSEVGKRKKMKRGRAKGLPAGLCLFVY